MGIRSNISSAVKRVLGFGRNANPLKNLRAYQGALVSRLTSDWMSSQLSADAEIRNSLRKLRDRSRELVRNNPYARQAKRTTQINIVGTGMKFQSLVVQQRGGKRDQRVNNIIEEAWSEWTQADSCDCAGKYSFHQFEWLASGALCESGEAIFRIVRKPFGNSQVPLALQMIESDLLDEEYDGKTLNKNNEWRNGVEVDEWGRALRYAILTKHPGDAYYLDYSANRKLHIFIPAEDIVHLFLPERPGQNRGVPWFHSVMADMHQLQGYEEAAVIRARAGASIMGFIQNDQGELIGDDVQNSQRIQSFEPGTFRYLMPNESVTVPDIDYPSQQYEMFVKNKIRRFATGIGCSFETISKDFSETNYSSSRLSLLEDREHWKFCQKYIIDNFHYRIFKEWLDLAVLSGVIDFPDYASNSKRYCKPRWTPPAQHYVDPLKEIKAYREAEQAGYMTKSQVIAQTNGGDYDDIISEIAREQEVAKSLGVTLDKDLDLEVEMGQLSLDIPQPEQTEQPPRSRKRKKSS
jgi:lambda family phage portal protein